MHISIREINGRRKWFSYIVFDYQKVGCMLCSDNIK